MGNWDEMIEPMQAEGTAGNMVEGAGNTMKSTQESIQEEQEEDSHLSEELRKKRRRRRRRSAGVTAQDTQVSYSVLTNS